jgi:hypothetical protein
VSLQLAGTDQSSDCVLAKVCPRSRRGNSHPARWRRAVSGAFKELLEVLDAIDQRLEALGIEYDGFAFADLLKEVIAGNANPVFNGGCDRGAHSAATSIRWTADRRSSNSRIASGGIRQRGMPLLCAATLTVDSSPDLIQSRSFPLFTLIRRAQVAGVLY